LSAISHQEKQERFYLIGEKLMAEGSNGAVAQLGERLVCNQEATGSIPVSSTKALQEIIRAFEAAGSPDQNLCSRRVAAAKANSWFGRQNWLQFGV
jgi:hypothetical protein